MVYYGTNSQHAPLPEASFRLPSQTLTKSCGSQFFVDMLHLGHPQQSQELPPSPTSSPENVITPNYLSESRQSTYPERRDFAEETRSPRSSTRAPFNEHARGPTPPSDDNQERDSRVKPRNELFFPIPTTDSHEVILRNHLSIRNVFALIFKASLVGLDFYQALCDLLDRMNQYFPDQDNKQEIIEYLYKQGLEDVRNDPESAMGLMAWSEQSDVQWTDGFREGFVHCVGMYHEVKQLPNFNNVRFLTQQSLQQKSNELYLRIKEAENMLADFDFSEMWPMSSANPPMARVSFVRFQVSLKQLYENIYFQWPPKTYGETWLNRELTQRLQHDFGLLYDYIVDHAVVWEKKNARRYSEDDELESEAEDMTPWKNNAYEFKMAKRGSLTFTADIPNLPIVDMLIKFDFKHACAHIPHPFPLTPESSKPITPPRKGFFSKSHKTAMDPVTVARQTELAYSRATNVQALGHSKHENALIKHFINLEYGDKIGEVDPYDARLGRWILLYGILQVLSQICSDTPGIRHKKGVSYFLNPPMRGLPSWEKDPDNNDIESSSQENTHCWRAAKRWEEERQEQMSSMRRHHEITIPGYDNGMGARNYSSSHLPSSSSLLSTPTLISSRRVSPSPAPEDIVGGVVPNITDSPSFARQGSMIPPVPTAMPETPRRNMPHRMVSPSTPRNGTPTRGHAPMSVQGSTFKPPPEWA